MSKIGGILMALEIRMVDHNGALVRTLEDVAVPALPVKMAPGTMMLADYCFGNGGPWVKPERLIEATDVAAVVYNRRGKIEDIVVGERRPSGEEQKRQALRSLCDCLLTKYPGESGKEVFLFYLSARVKERLSKVLR
jgi:hypothetical protein